MNKKNNYKNEVTNIFVLVFIIIFFILFLICGGISIKQLMEEELGIEVLIIVICLLLSTLGLFAFFACRRCIYEPKVNREKAKHIMENGTKVKGKIIDVRTEREDISRVNEFSRYRYFYHLIVEYSNKIENIKVETPRVNFHPNYLTSKDVDVYLYQNDFYVDNFKLDLDRIEKYKKKVIKMNLMVILSFVLLCITNAIIIFLSTNNIIPSEIGMKLCMMSLVIWALILVGISIIKGIKDIIKKENK